MQLNINELLQLVKQLAQEEGLQKLESKNFLILNVSGVITVKFKQFKGLSGYFTVEEFNNEETLMTILKTLETEMNKNNK
jgi:hypothetical protein